MGSLLFRLKQIVGLSFLDLRSLHNWHNIFLAVDMLYLCTQMHDKN